MTIPEQISCNVVRDLLVPYVAGEVSPVTLEWMNSHLSTCPACRAALSDLTADSVSVPPTAPRPAPEQGRRLVGRIRRQVVLLIALVIASVGLAAGVFLFWGANALFRETIAEEHHPVPRNNANPADAARIDLSALGLSPAGVDPASDGAVARFRDAAGNTVTVGFYKLPSPYRARAAYEQWDRSFATKQMSVQESVGSVAFSTFQSGGQDYQGWHDGRWFIVVQVPETVPAPADLRAGIVRQLGQVLAR